jgi:phospholipid/cholesterol/gamma-HCH transport system ATP-binding protein
VSYSVGDEKIIEDVSLGYPQGCTTIIMGASGSGKSSLLKISAGLYPTISGKLLFKGENVSRMNEREYQIMQKQTGFLFQDGALWANMSLYDNLTLPILVTDSGISRKELDSIVERTIAVMDFDHPLDQRPAMLSAGERKIFSFLRSIVTDPEVFFMDEPTTFIDRSKVGLIKEKITKLKAEHKTIIGITHELEFGLELADYLIFMEKGRVMAHGPVSDVLESRDPAVITFKNSFLME